MSASVARRFSRAAPSYERGAGLHRHVAARLVEFLPDPSDSVPERVLELGCGTGILTALVRRRYPEATLCALDIAEGMARHVRDSQPADDRLHCLVADARTFSSRRPFDLVVSSSSLHWVNPLPPLMANISRLLDVGGRFTGAIMVDGTLRELHALRRTLAPEKLPPGRLPRPAETVDAIESSGFTVEETEEETVRTRYHSADDFLRTIHAQGLTGGDVSRASTPLSRKDLRRLTGAYDESHCDLKGGVYATFEVLYFSATRAERGAAPSPAPGATA